MLFEMIFSAFICLSTFPVILFSPQFLHVLPKSLQHIIMLIIFSNSPLSSLYPIRFRVARLSFMFIKLLRAIAVLLTFNCCQLTSRFDVNVNSSDRSTLYLYCGVWFRIRFSLNFIPYHSTKEQHFTIRQLL